MKKSTWVFALVFALLLGYVWFVESKHPTNNDKTIFNFKADEVHRLGINQRGTLVVLEKGDRSNWQITSPIQDIADTTQIDNLVQSLSNLNAISTVSKEESLDSYGLGNDAMTLRIGMTSGKSLEAKVGTESPTHEGVYAVFPPASEIKLIHANIKQTLSSPVDAWRDHNVVHFDPTKVERISLEQPSHPVEFSNLKEGWFIDSPVKAKADETKIRQLMTTLGAIRATQFSPPDQPVDLTHPERVIQLWVQGEKEPKRITLGKKTPQGLPAQTSGRNVTYYLPEKILTALDQDPKTYVDLHLLSFKEEDVTKVEVNRGNTHVVFEKSGNSWKVTEPAKSKVEEWKANMIINDALELQEDPEVNATFPSITNPQAVVSFWKGKDLIAQVSIGETKTINEKTSYAVEIEPSKKQAWSNAELLVKDLPKF